VTVHLWSPPEDNYADENHLAFATLRDGQNDWDGVTAINWVTDAHVQNGDLWVRTRVPCRSDVKIAWLVLELPT
jgi:hypothetical protein